MILYLKNTNKSFEFTSDNTADFQVIISRIKGNSMKVNEKTIKGYVNIPLNSPKVKKLKSFILEHFNNVTEELNSLIEVS